nr:hypothetical protein [Tanacetum cinerariifolium]
MADAPTMKFLQDSVNELGYAILKINKGMTRFLVSQNAISNELNRTRTGEGTSNNGGIQNHSGNGNRNNINDGRGYGRISNIKFSKFNVDDVKGWVNRCRQFFKINEGDYTHRVELVSMHVH